MTEVPSDARLRAAVLADRRRIAAGVRPLYHATWATTPDGPPMVDLRIRELPIIHLFLPDLAGALDGARLLVARTLLVDPTSFDLLLEPSPPSA